MSVGVPQIKKFGCQARFLNHDFFELRHEKERRFICRWHQEGRLTGPRQVHYMLEDEPEPLRSSPLPSPSLASSPLTLVSSTTGGMPGSSSSICPSGAPSFRIAGTSLSLTMIPVSILNDGPGSASRRRTGSVPLQAVSRVSLCVQALSS